jgi:hypothetical protein
MAPAAAGVSGAMTLSARQSMSLVCNIEPHMHGKGGDAIAAYLGIAMSCSPLNAMAKRAYTAHSPAATVGL